jgi:hypothetical protein
MLGKNLSCCFLPDPNSSPRTELLSLYVHVEGVLVRVLETAVPTGDVDEDLGELLKLSETLVRRDVWGGRALSRVGRCAALSKRWSAFMERASRLVGRLGSGIKGRHGDGKVF